MVNPAGDNSSSLVAKASSVSSATLISRILGYARDMLIAKYFGASMAADAFFVAYKIPNLFRRLLGEGSLSTSFIPVYTRYLTAGDEEEAEKLVRSVFGVFGLLFILLTFGGIIFAPQIVSVIAPGFSDTPEKFRLTVTLTRIMFPFLMAVGLGAIALGILNSRRIFFIPAVAPSMLSISEIIFILAISPFLDPPVKALALGVVAGGFAQFFIQAAFIKKDTSIRPQLNLNHPGLKKIYRLMLPAIFGLAVYQLNILVDTVCATLLMEGSVSFLYYGNRLVQFPLALFGTAMATVTLPLMSENAAKKQERRFKDTFSTALRGISYFILPSAIGLIIFGEPIIKLLFERGEFTSLHTSSTAWVLMFYSFGLIFFAGVKVAVSAFHSLQDTKTPVLVACVALAINAILNIIVVTYSPVREYFSTGGLAFSTSIASAFNFILLMLIFTKRKGGIGFGKIKNFFLNHIFLTVFLAAFLLIVKSWSENWNLILRVAFVLFSASAFYIFLSIIFKIPEFEIMKKTFLTKNET
ncbi:MAG: murein biosynthesis integral membrane protein MurJ [Elusimicrobiota bacterium]